MDLPFRRPLYVLIGAGVVLAAVLPSLSGMILEQGEKAWLPDHRGEAEEQYAHFQRTFGSDQFIVVGIDLGRRLQAKDRAWLTSLEHRLNHLTGVGLVLSPVTAADQLTEEEFVKEHLASPLVRSWLISQDKTLLRLFLFCDRDVEPEEIVTGVRQALSSELPGGAIYQLAGQPVFRAALNELTNQSTLRLYPVATLLILGALFALYRPWPLALSVGLSILAVPALAAGLGQIVRVPMNPITLAAFPVVLSATTAYVVHSLAALNRARIEGRDAGKTLKVVSRPILLSAATSAAGFFSLLVSSFPAIRGFGLLAGMGALLALPVALFVVPALLILVVKKGPVLRRSVHVIPLPKPLTPRTWVAATLVILVLGLAVLPALRIEANALYLFPPDDPLVLDYASLESRGIGLVPVVLQLNGRDEYKASGLPYLREVDSLCTKLDLLPEVGGVFSLPGVFRDVLWRTSGNEEDTLPQTEWRITSIWRELDAMFPQVLKRMTADEGRQSYAVLWLFNEPSRDMNATLDSIQTVCRSELPEDFKWSLTGSVPLIISAQHQLVRSLVTSLLLAALVIGSILAAIARDIRIFLATIMCNGLPVIVGLAALSLTGTPLTIGTAMVAGVALGLVVDDTIHMVVAYRDVRRENTTAREAAGEAIRRVGEPVLWTSIVLCIGFAALVLSPLLPVHSFGWVMTLILATAVLADLVFLPGWLIALEGAP